MRKELQTTVCMLRISTRTQQYVAPVQDLMRLFGRYYGPGASEDDVDIKLMTEGPMKGQAFVGLPTIAAAKRALSDVHGYVLHGKPMLVQFARARKTGPAT
eukprot:Colp12_sorted_trinity150504_noHs@11380